MLAIKIWNYLRGYVIIKVEGLTLERLLNLAAMNNIYLWDVKRISHIELNLVVSTQGFRSLKEVVKKVGCRVQILEKKGLPFIWAKLKGRKVFAIGILIFGILIFTLTSFIWTIEIQGMEQTPEIEILKLLEENQIKRGIFKHRIKEDEIHKILLNEYDYFSFLDIQIEGTALKIEIKEQDLPPEKVDKNYPCHIVARKKGVIIKIIARNGQTLVKKGQIVNQGDILISGIVQDLDYNFSTSVHADGEVLAITRYNSIIEEPIIKKEEKPTGKTYKQMGLKIGNKGLKLIKGEIPFENYIESIDEKKLINWGKLSLDIPLKIVNYEYQEVRIEEIKQNIDFLKKKTQLAGIEKINKELPNDVEIQSKSVKYDVKDNILIASITVEAIEDIGKKQIINN